MGSIQEDSKEDEAEDEEGLTTYPYERLKTTSEDPVIEIDVTKREVFLFCPSLISAPLLIIHYPHIPTKYPLLPYENVPKLYCVKFCRKWN